MGLLQRGKLKPKYIDILTNESAMKYYGYAFTAASADSLNNYERFEQIGDVSANKFIVWYAYRRFPQLDCTSGVKVVARLRINYGAKETFAPLAEKLGFWDYISAASEGTKKNTKYRDRHKKDLLEDTFEAFIGCTEYLLDKGYRTGVGYAIVYDILKSIFDDLDISLRFEDLFDAKTRLKETFDMFQELGELVYLDTRQEAQDNRYTQTISTVYQVARGADKHMKFPGRGWIKLGEGISSRKGDAEQQAAENALILLKHNGIYREPPPEYQYFCTQI